MSEKSKVETDLEKMSPDQFKQLSGMVQAEATRRDGGDAGLRRKLGQMSDAELARFTSEQGWNK